ncbi:MAG: SPOR domain-containing protein, partial [Spirochaetaceae bacterium]
EATPSGDTPSAAPQDDEDGKDTVDEQTSGHSGASGVQVGSFRGEDNARDMRREMERIGFDAEIRKGPDGRFHRVIIPVAEATEAQELLVRLKEQGFEGFLLFDEEE